MRLYKILILALITFTITSCENILDEFADKDTEAAILYQARLYLAEGLWDQAIETFEQLAPETLAETVVTVEYASAYSGRCGLDFLEVAEHFAAYNSTTDDFFDLFIDIFESTTAADYADCISSETILKTIYTPASGIVDSDRGKFLMAFNSLAKVGAILTFRADPNNDSVITAGWDPCDAGTGLADLPNAEVNEIITAISLFKANIDALYGVDPENPFFNLMASLNTACTLEPTICTTYTTAGTNALQRTGIRGLIVETDDNFGLNINPGDTAANVLACNQ